MFYILKAIPDEASAAEEIDEVFHPLILIDQGANYCRLFSLFIICLSLYPAMCD